MYKTASPARNEARFSWCAAVYTDSRQYDGLKGWQRLYDGGRTICANSSHLCYTCMSNSENSMYSQT